MTFDLVSSFPSELLKQFYSYKRPFQEVKGYFIKHEEDGTDTIFVNALGIDPIDVNITVKAEHKMQLLNVYGTTKDKICGEDFSVNLVFYFNKQVRKIRKSFRSGLVILKIEYDVPPQPSVEIVED